MDDLLNGLKAGAEATRLRLLALCSHGEMTVSELTQILGQSQPRVSRHLKLLCEAGLLERLPEGSWVFYRLARSGPSDKKGGGTLARQLVAMLPADDPLLARDFRGLDAVRAQRAAEAAAYFRDNAQHWDEIRSLHIDETEVERRLVALLEPENLSDLLDIGTGTGRILELFGKHGVNAVGLDASREMLAVARANLAKAGVANCYVRQGDMYRLPWNGPSFDAVTIHQVLHFADEPGHAIAEAARVLRPGGKLVIADFAPHQLDQLRTQHAHRRLGFSDAEIAGWMEQAGLTPQPVVHLPGGPLTVSLWTAHKAEELTDEIRKMLQGRADDERARPAAE
jgi:ubiquinone/menaquinone biosynthesis C-methylase UbiE/DNA-binding transcriptional ArsR family regulator